MATEAEINQLVTTWPPTWKLGFKSSTPVTASTSGKDVASKDTILPITMKETKLRSMEKITTKETPKDATKGAEQESQQDEGIEGLGGEGAESPRGT